MGEWTYRGGNGSIDVPAVQVKTSRYTPAERGSNGRIIDQNGNDIRLWVVDVTADFHLAGQTAQSSRRRHHYARNYVQPRIHVAGQCGDSYQYQLLAEFVRATQLNAIMYGDHENVENPTITLSILPGGWNGLRGTKGVTSSIIVEGYVESIDRGAKRFEFAPEWSFDFVVSKAVNWLIKDSDEAGRRLLAWGDFIVKDAEESLATVRGGSYQTDPDDRASAGTLGAVNEALERTKVLTSNPFTGAANVLGR